MSNIEKAYQDGYQSGLNWPDAWMNHHEPGGPWVPSAGYDAGSRAVKAQFAAENHAWKDGWKIGLAEKIVTKRVNPFVGTDRNAAHHDSSSIQKQE